MEIEAEIISKDELSLLLEKTKNIRHKAQILLMNDCGVRVSEMLKLRWSNFDFRKNLLTIKSLKKKANHKQNRVLPLTI